MLTIDCWVQVVAQTLCQIKGSDLPKAKRWECFKVLSDATTLRKRATEVSSREMVLQKTGWVDGHRSHQYHLQQWYRHWCFGGFKKTSRRPGHQLSIKEAPYLALQFCDWNLLLKQLLNYLFYHDVTGVPWKTLIFSWIFEVLYLLSNNQLV